MFRSIGGGTILITGTIPTVDTMNQVKEVFSVSKVIVRLMFINLWYSIIDTAKYIIGLIPFVFNWALHLFTGCTNFTYKSYDRMHTRTCDVCGKKTFKYNFQWQQEKPKVGGM